MAKTTYSTGVPVTSKWLNGAKRIYFDGQDIDWHYDPLGLESLILRGPNGLDSRYVTLPTDQPNLSATGVYISGSPISGNKVATGLWSFGYNDTLNPMLDQNVNNAPKSFLTNLKYNYAGGIVSPSVAQKFSSLSDEDLVTKKIVSDVLLTVDNGTY